MKKALLALTLGVALVGFTGCNFDPEKWGDSTVTQSSASASSVNTLQINVVNRASDTIDMVYIADTSNASWGSDRESGTIAISGGSKSYSVTNITCATGKVDLLVHFSSGGHTYKYDQSLTCGSVYEWTITSAATVLP
ncbi:MAG: hypothetical protein KU37_08080 [Sulfuricurvum sp. PC08-66]|nr:MAG: hypothetical protein KU37_08080 [Sulfuricurvum sp. PC08-66]